MAPPTLGWLVLVLAIARCRGAAIVTDVSPTRIGWRGGVITIHGSGFSEDVFNQFDPVLGNKIWFANEFVSVPCQNPVNWNFLLENPQDPSTTKIVCSLPGREGTKGSNWFKLILKVDGTEVANHKSIEYKSDYTPEIREVFPRYGAPGELVTIRGRIFTKEYGNANFGDSGSVENRREESILAMMFGMSPCEITDELGNVYNLTLDNPESNYGSLTCMPQGTAIGPHVGTLYVSGQYGTSRVVDAYSINSKGQLFIYHTLPVISSVSPNTGGDAGGTHITLTGNSFNAYPNATVVTIGSSPCSIVSISNYELTCTTPAATELTDTTLGPRGLLLEVWSETEADVEDTSTLDTSAADYSSQTWEESDVTFNETDGFTGRLRGYFMAPYTGRISFYIEASGPSALYLSNNTDPANKEMIRHQDGPRDKGDGHRTEVELVKGQLYYMEAVMVQPAGEGKEENFLRVSLWLHKTKHHRAQTDLAHDAEQGLVWRYDRQMETQRVTWNNMENANTSTIMFEHQGIKAKEELDMVDSSEWNQTLSDMFSYTCTFKAKRFGIRQTYENEDFTLPGGGSPKYHAYANHEAYCGEKALRNHDRIMHGYGNRGRNRVDAIKNPYLCFAAKGESYEGTVRLLIRWKDKRNRGRRDWLNVKNVWQPKEDEWSYQCVHFEDSVRDPNNTWVANDINDKSYLEIEDIILNRGMTVGYYWMDEISIGPEDVSAGHERLAPSLRNTKDVRVKTTEVYPVDDNGFDIKISPWTCNEEVDDFELLGVQGAEIVGLDISAMSPQEAYDARKQYLSTEDSVTFSHDQWFGGTVTVERKMRGTRKIQGTYTLTYEGKTVEMSPNPTDKNILAALEGFGMVGVKTVFGGTAGAYDRCFDARIHIKFEMSLAGDVPMIELNATGLSLENGEKDSYMQVELWRRGGVKVPRPGGDFFRLPVTVPTVSVSVDGFMASCDGPDCSFSHDPSLTPSLSSVVSSVVDGAVQLTIIGSGFTEDTSDFIVQVGPLDCKVNAASTSSITCTLEPGLAAVYNLSVVVKSRGLATQATQLTHTIQLEIFTNSPAAGSLGGGTSITVTGSGFPDTLEGWNGGSVTIDGAQCKVTETDFSEFKCLTSAKPSARRYKRSAGIAISLGELSVSGGSFLYDASLTPAVSSVSPTQSSPLGGGVLVINGTALGAAWGQVLLGDNECKIIGWFPTYIKCILPSNTHGEYPVHVAVPGNGFAEVTTVPGITYDFVVTDMTPRKGSTLGGTKIKLTGSGFGDCSNIEVKFSDLLTCEISECSNTAISCTTRRKGQTVTINNGGKHPVYGPGYVWSNQELEVYPGDTVEWRWTLTVNSKETGISVHQVDTPTTNEYNGRGFQAEKAPKGRLQHKFETPGTYYYSSQPVFGVELFMPGLVNVVADTEDSVGSLVVTMAGQLEAAQQVVADTGSITVPGCALTGSYDCVSDPVSTDTFLFTLAVCLTPVVSTVSITAGAANYSSMPLEGYQGAELTFQGQGFSENSCQNVISIGDDHSCIVTSASATELVCTVDGNGATPLPSLTPQKICVTVINSGSALMAVPDPDTAVFQLVPQVVTTNAANNIAEVSVGGSSGGTSSGGGGSVIPPDSDYCTLNSEHTMCKWSVASEECAAKTSARGFTDDGKQIILDKHNELRRKVAKGEEAGQPAASNMNKLVWNDELAAIAQRWSDQCTFGHDTERTKVDGTYVGQNAFIGMSSQTSDQATMMTAIGDSAQAWYDEVTDPGFDAANIKPYVFSSGTGHYTQVAWAETAEIGCGWVYYSEEGWQKSLVVCNYAVGGNMQSAAMYEQGDACSACPSGYSCEDGLCTAPAADLMVAEDGNSVPDGGSWAGGYLYVISGFGLHPFGGSDTVRVTFGEAPYSAGCKVVDVAFDYISCLVPDFTKYKSDATRKVVPVTVNLGYDQQEPVKELEHLSYTYDDALTAEASTMTPAAITTSESITVGGSQFGSAVRVFLRNKDVPSSRKRRALPELEENVVHEVQKRETHEFWSRFSAKEEPSWRCLHGASCNHDDITSMPSELDRKKREIPDDWEQLVELEREDDEMLLEQICLEDPHRCMEMLSEMWETSERQRRSVDIYQEEEMHTEVEVLGRSKRAADEAALLEMALLTEGTFEATVTAASLTSITFLPPALPAGQYDVIINVDGQGNSLVSQIGRLTSTMAVTSINPDTGSLHGGQDITITGSGFCATEGATAVTIGGLPCPVLSAVPDSVSCITPPGSEGSQTVSVTSCTQTASSDYNFAAASSPAVSSVSPTAASGATTLSISGSNFGTEPTVKVGQTVCAVLSSTDISVSCDLPGIPGGDYQVVVYNSLIGLSDNATTFTSTLEILSITPSSGSFGGGSPLVITGTGFDTMAPPVVTVCTGLCDIQAITTSEISCLSPTNDATGATETCDVVLAQDSGTATSMSAFTYDQALTPSISSISPVRGGTGGGTLVTITGTGFASLNNKVMIDGSICDIATESATEITCYTNYHAGAIKAPVVVDVPDQGYAIYTDQEAAIYYYIDRWSSIWTWGGLGTPLKDEFIVITEGQTILLDVSTPVLAFLLIKGGTLMFDSENTFIELQSKYILLVEGGALQIGTEEEKYPVESKAIITMHGNVRCTEMPVFGCKCIGVRNGTLDFHGAYRDVTWTHLAVTAAAGDTEITMKQPVDWRVGDHIAIATTGDRNSMKENEEHHIAAISADGYTITLEKPLKYQHISIEQTFNGRVVETRGEVGLLTRNVLIRGTKNEQFVEVLPACEEDFDSGVAFGDALQTCFAGKFGEELGHDEMGSVIIISPKYQDQGLVAARIEFVEFENAGQAFRVGRYPIHFHLPGNMNTSYVRGNAIHHSNNRACTLHNVANMVVERNVVYNVKGLSFFLEDGIELNNTLQYNLAMFTRMSNSLLNPDINPASFWIVNAYNRFRHNACAGGTHHCYWLRPARFPDGPSWTMKYCPNKVPFLEFWNNTAHSMGWYGFWIFGQSNHATYDPHSGDLEHGFCNGESIQTTIGSFTTWNNKRGVEVVSGANLRFVDHVHMDHDFAGFEIFTSKGPYGDGGPGITNALIVGHSLISDMTKSNNASCTPGAIHMTDSGYNVKDTTFVNFDRDCYGIRMRYMEAGSTVGAARVEGLVWDNVPNKVYLPPGHDNQALLMKDVDGSLTGGAGNILIGNSPLNPTECVPDATGELGGGGSKEGHQGSVCPEGVTFHRVNMVAANAPSSLKYSPITITNDYGTSSRPWQAMDLNWAMLLPEDVVNWVTYDGAPQVTNISYTGSVSGMHEGEGNHLLIGHKFYQLPDRFNVLAGQTATNGTAALAEPPTYDTAMSGQWWMNVDQVDNKTEMIYIVSDKGPMDGGWRRKKRGAVAVPGTFAGANKASLDFKVFRCFYSDCLPPPPPTLPEGRPLDFKKWSDASAWLELGYNMPKTGDDVFIPPGVWFVMDIDPPVLSRIYLYGGLEIEDTADRKLEVGIFLIQGGRFQAGLPSAPFQNNFELVLHGDHYTEDQPLPGVNLGAKALGVFGFVDMVGQDVGTTWVKLAETAPAGSTTLTLSSSVTWAAGSEVVVSSTSWELLETERMTIASVSGNTITLTSALQFDHVSHEATLSDGQTFRMSGEVGLLTRNVKIVGNDYEEIEDEQFGARVLVGSFEQEGVTYTGYGRFENVEFLRAGQEGWYDNFDPRYALAFLDTGDSESAGGKAGAMESYVKKCAFNYGYNSAIGVFGTNNIPVEDNVIFRFINNGIFDEGEGNTIVNNLVTRGEAVARIKAQAANIEFFGGINVRRATKTIMTGNVAAGCAQGGFITRGVPSDEEYVWANNEAHGGQHGVHVTSRSMSRVSSKVVVIKDFFAWMNYDYAVMVHNHDSVEVSNIISIDNGVGFMSNIIGPSADAHQFEEKYVSLRDSVFVSVSDVFDCAKAVSPDIHKAKLEKKRKFFAKGRWIEGNRKAHHTGVVWPIFQSNDPDDDFPWHTGVKGAAGSNPAMRGIMQLSGVTFANFKENCGAQDIVFRTNIAEDDVNWPINASAITFVDTADDNKLYMDVPLAGKLSPSDCSDFDCDGFKKALIYDTDGSVAGDGVTGTIIPDSAYEWDGNPARGLGYYRVPKPMVTELNGDKIENEDKMPNTGIYRDGSCGWNEKWRAYKCGNINHRLMMIESMDRDTKIRRLSPIAMLADAGPNGYIDLVNGPQDHSCCSGYICAERLSTFYTMVATGLEYEVMFTSIPPQKFRIHMLYNDGGDAVRLKIWFPKQQRLDIYIDGLFMNPENLDFDADDYNLLPPDVSVHVPVLTGPNGANFFDPGSGHLYVIVKGPSVIDIKTQPIVVLKLGLAVPIENFFESNVVGNLAGLLGIDPKNIRVTNIVREGSVGRRRRSEAPVTDLEFEIGPPPATTLGDFLPPPEKTTTTEPGGTTENPKYTTAEGSTTTTTAWVAPQGHLAFDELAMVTATISTAFQTGGLGDALDLDVAGLAVEKPIPPPPAPPPLPPAELRGSTEGIPMAEAALAESTALLESMEAKELAVPSGLGMARQPEEAQEMKTMVVNPGVYVIDSNGKSITVLGHEGDPWICTVTVVAGPGGGVVGNISAPFVDGIAQFSELAIDQAGDDYVLEFSVTYPTGTVLAPIQSIPFSVAPRPLGIKLDDEPPLRKENTTFEVSAVIWDEALDDVASASVLSMFTWECTISLLVGDGNLTGTTTVTVAKRTSKVLFDDLALDTPGVNYQLKVDCYSEEASATVMVISLPFHVHDFPDTGLLRKTSTGFKYHGLFSQVETLVDAYNKGLVESLSCEGCPPGSLVQPDKKPKSSQDVKMVAGDQKSTNATKTDLETWDPCNYPTFLADPGACPAEQLNDPLEESTDENVEETFDESAVPWSQLLGE